MPEQGREDRLQRPRLLDLFCGAGGAAMGYHRAGFDVFGVDKNPQPNYPFPFLQADAIEIMEFWPDCSLAEYEFDAIHASPPCQVNSTISKWRAMGRSGDPEANGHLDLISPTRRVLRTTQVPYIIENVPGARLDRDVILCGSQFGLEVRRHRWFELGRMTAPLVSPCVHAAGTIGVYGHGGDNYHTVAEWRRAMGIDWMTRPEMAQAIPPAYTDFLGRELLAQIGQVAA